MHNFAFVAAAAADVATAIVVAVMRLEINSIVEIRDKLNRLNRFTTVRNDDSSATPFRSCAHGNMAGSVEYVLVLARFLCGFRAGNWGKRYQDFQLTRTLQHTCPEWILLWK